MNPFGPALEKYNDPVHHAKTHSLIHGSIQSVNSVLILAVTSTCVTLSITRVGLVVPITFVIGACLCIFCEIVGDYLKGKEQKKFEGVHLLVQHDMISIIEHTKSFAEHTIILF